MSALDPFPARQSQLLRAAEGSDGPAKHFQFQRSQRLAQRQHSEEHAKRTMIHPFLQRLYDNPENKDDRFIHNSVGDRSSYATLLERRPEKPISPVKLNMSQKPQSTTHMATSEYEGSSSAWAPRPRTVIPPNFLLSSMRVMSSEPAVVAENGRSTLQEPQSSGQFTISVAPNAVRFTHNMQRPDIAISARSFRSPMLSNQQNSPSTTTGPSSRLGSASRLLGAFARQNLPQQSGAPQRGAPMRRSPALSRRPGVSNLRVSFTSVVGPAPIEPERLHHNSPQDNNESPAELVPDSNPEPESVNTSSRPKRQRDEEVGSEVERRTRRCLELSTIASSSSSSQTSSSSLPSTSTRSALTSLPEPLRNSVEQTNQETTDTLAASSHLQLRADDNSDPEGFSPSQSSYRSEHHPSSEPLDEAFTQESSPNAIQTSIRALARLFGTEP